MFHYLSRNKLWIATILASLAFILIHVHLYDSGQTYGSDSQENLAGAYNIAKYNTYAVNTLDNRPHPTATREPLFPLMVGLVIKMKNIFADREHNIHNKPIETIYHLEIEPARTINKLTLINIALLLVTIVSSAIFVRRLTQNYFLVFYTAITLIFSASLAVGAHGFLTEILAALLINIISILFYNYKELSHERKYWIYLGMAISALVLTKAIFLYFIPLVFVYLISLNFQSLKNREQPYSKNFLIFLSCIAVIVGGWMLRNYIDLGRFYIADRKAQTLMYRAEYDYLSSKEYPYTYAIWAPGLSRHFLSKDSEKDWARLVNRRGNDQIILDAYFNIFMEYFKDKKLELNGVYPQADLMKLEKISIHKIMANPVGHLKLSLAFLWRSLFIEDGTGLRYLGIKLPYEDNADQRVDSFPMAIFINLPFWLGFFYVMFISIRKRDAASLGLILIPAYTILVYSFLGFSHPRYMSMLIPMLTVTFCLALKKFMDKLSSRYPVLATKLF